MRGNPVCIKCESEESPLWTNAENLGAVCLDCWKELNGTKSDTDTDRDDKKSTMRRTRSMRNNAAAATSTSAPLKSKASGKSGTAKGQGRRVIFKKTPSKSPTAVATPVTSESVFYKGLYYQKGDIVSLIDEEDNVYYAQLRGFLTDAYCEKSGVITWLLPTQESPPPEECFDPSTYIIGPEEDIPRNLDCMEFIMHAPSDYYKSKTTPFPVVYPSPAPGYIWTRLEPIQRLLYGPGAADEEHVNIACCKSDE